MSGTWYDDDFAWRASLTVINAASGDVRDIEWEPEDDWDDFWTNIEDTDDAFDVVVVDPLSGDVLDFHWHDLDVSARTGALRIDDATVVNEMSHLHVYWGKADAADLTTSFTFAPGAFADAVLDTPSGSDLVVLVGPARDEEVPRDVLTKRSAEVLHFWLDLSAVLRTRRTTHQGSRDLETVHTLSMSIKRNGATEEDMFDVEDLRVADEGRLVRVPVEGGTHDEDYVAIITITTTLGRVLQPRVLVQVRDPSEASS